MHYSVIIPTYNRASLLERTLDSVLKQSLPPTEIILVDDGSTDETDSLFETYQIKAKTLGIELTCLKQKNQGVSHARNQGIMHAKTNWIALLDSDDAWEVEKIQKQILALQNQTEYKICHTNEKWFRNDVRVNPMKKHEKKGGWIYQHCLPLCTISPSSVLIHNTVFQSVGLFDANLPACEDYDLWLRITSKFPVLYLDETLTIKYGGHDDQLSKKHWGMDRFRMYALKKMLASPCLSVSDRKATESMLQKKSDIFLNGAKKRGKVNYPADF